MPPSRRGRRITITLVALAAVLTAGRWTSGFLAERMWEASVSEAVASAGARHALLAIALELAVLLATVTWMVTHLVVASRVALPDIPPPDRAAARAWPERVPRWTVAAAGLVLGILLGAGAGRWLDALLLTFDGAPLGVYDPLLGADLGVFVGAVPLWLALQARLSLVLLVSLGCVAAIHAAGGTLRAPRGQFAVVREARGQLAILLTGLGLALAWGALLEPYRLAAGLRGPMLPSEFLLRSLVAKVEAGLGAGAAVLSLMWWLRVRGGIAAVLWGFFLFALITGRALPLRTQSPMQDSTWRRSARALDSVAYGLAGVEQGGPGLSSSAVPSLTLWDDSVLVRAVADSGTVSALHRGWLVTGGAEHPVWFAVRTLPGQNPVLLSLSDDRVSPTGGVLAWREGDSVPVPGSRPFRELGALAFRPGASPVIIGRQVPGVALDGWGKRLVLAWALQTPKGFSAAAGTKAAWRLDPVDRLRAAAPFAHWEPARARLTSAGLVWQSDGLLTSDLFPSSRRIEWASRRVSMVRPAFMGVVDAASGAVRVFLRDSADRLGAAWGRIARPLVEPASAIPVDLRRHQGYPEGLFEAQVRALEGPAWGAGTLERTPEGRPRIAPYAPGGSSATVVLRGVAPGAPATLFWAARTAAGDSLRLIPLDSLHSLDAGAALLQQWQRFPFSQQVHDSVEAEGGAVVAGALRVAPTADGVLAYQPEWVVSSSGRAQLVVLNLALGNRLGTGGSPEQAWSNLRRESAALPTGTGLQALLNQARQWMRHADSALKRGDLQEFGRAMDNLRDLLERRRDVP